MDTFPPGPEPRHRFDFFEPGDKTALVCIDVAEMQRVAIDQLVALGYKIHTGLFLDDSILKLRAHAYDVIIVLENFNGSSLENHPLLAESIKLPPAQRRRQLVVLVGPSLNTNDEFQAFAFSADVAVSQSDVVNLRPVIRRAVNRAAEFYAPLNEAIAAFNTHDAGTRTVA